MSHVFISEFNMSCMTKDRVNYIKCCCVCVDLFPAILCTILTTDVLPRDLFSKVKSFPGIPLSKEQENKVSRARTAGCAGFDLTLFYTLIRNLGLPSVVAPSSGWGKLPISVSQITTGDDVERMRDLRNNVYGHASSTGISDPEFRGYWKTIQDICARMDTQYCVSTFTDKLKGIEKVDFVPKAVSDYIDIVDELLKKDNELQNELQMLKGKDIANVQLIIEQTNHPIARFISNSSSV